MEVNIMKFEVGIIDILVWNCPPDPFSSSGGIVMTISCLPWSRFGVELILKLNWIESLVLEVEIWKEISLEPTVGRIFKSFCLSMKGSERLPMRRNQSVIESHFHGYRHSSVIIPGLCRPLHQRARFLHTPAPLILEIINWLAYSVAPMTFGT